MRKGIRSLLCAESEFQVIAEARDGLDAINCVRELRPDVLLLELKLPRSHGIEVVRRVRALTKTVVLTSCTDTFSFKEAIRNGAAGYILKNSSVDELSTAIRCVVAGDVWLDPGLWKVVFENSIQPSGSNDPLDTLTHQERVVLELAAKGLTAQEIASRLYLSPRTVETHRANLNKKLSLRGTTELVRFAIHHGIASV